MRRRVETQDVRETSLHGGGAATSLADPAAEPLTAVQRLDAIERCGKRLGEAVDSLNRDQLRALADRVGLDTTHRASRELRISIKRRLTGAQELIRRE